MAGIAPPSAPGGALGASWERCELKHRLVRDAARPILRLQSTEIAPRLEKVIERAGGRQGIFRQLAGLAAETGACLVVTDCDGVLVRLEGTEEGRGIFEQNGIAIGSCWDERIAGTNGVSMALSEGTAYTVRGQDHYFAKLQPFSCTAVPLFDADNQIIGAANFSMVDRGNRADYLFARQLLGAAADRVQRILFERRFAETAILSVSSRGHRNLLRGNELVAINEDGIILGATAGAHRLAGEDSPARLKGKSFEMVFGADTDALDRVPERVLSVRRETKPSIDVSLRRPPAAVRPALPRRSTVADTPKPRRRRLPPSLRELAAGSHAMASLCARAQACFRRALPFVIEGESGTGKSGLVAALVEAAECHASRLVTVDCATLGDTPEDRLYFRTLVEQARVAGSLIGGELGPVTLVLENVDEMPAHAQAGLRMVLDQFEAGDVSDDTPRVMATSRRPLKDAVECGDFRDDLYFLLAAVVVSLPPLRSREGIDTLALDIASKIARTEVEITEEAMAAITSHDWPGNVRELRNVLQQGLIEGDGRRISGVDLTSITSNVPQRHGTADAPPAARPGIRYDERTMILDALAGARWNVSQAARTLGMGRATIHRKMAKYGISRNQAVGSG